MTDRLRGICGIFLKLVKNKRNDFTELVKKTHGSRLDLEKLGF